MTLSLSILSGVPQPASEGSSLLSPAGGSRRQTADLQELQALLNDEQATSPNGTADAGASVAGATSVEDKTVRLSRVQALLEASNSASESPSAMDAEETVALQDLLQVSQQVEPSSDSSMSISRDSDATGSARASESRRATLGLGEVQARLMQELNDFERRSSIFTRPLSQASRASRASQTTATVTGSTAGNTGNTGNTGTEAAGGLLGLLEAEQDSTLELQQYAEALRRERAEALAAQPSEPSEATEATDEILKKMRLSTSAARVEEFDATVTEDLRRLSQLLEPARAGVEEDSLEGGEEKAHAPQRFSPLVTRSGSKQVIHSVKSNQKYAGGAEEQLRVIDSVTPRKLFQDPPDADEPAQAIPGAPAVPTTQTAHTPPVMPTTQTPPVMPTTQTPPVMPTTQTPPVIQMTEKAGEPSREKEVETSLNLDQYFLPSKTQSSLDASSIVSASLQLTSSESISVDPAEPAKPADATPPTPHTPRIPEPTLSPIRPPTSAIPEPSLSPIDPPAKAVKEPSLSPVVLGRFIHP